MPLDTLIVVIAAFFASALTLYSGFGLGTVLLPVFALFFPVPMAVAATGVVHLLNNLFKGTLLWRQVDWRTVIRFGLPAIPAAIVGGWLLSLLGTTRRVFEWHAFDAAHGPTAAGLTVGLLMVGFAVLELQPWFQKITAPPRLMPLGGAMSGFFGGLTGQQGALRSMFLLKAGLSPSRFVSTGVMIAILVDLARLTTYAAAFATAGLNPAGREIPLIIAGTLAAFAGAYFATRRLAKVTVGFVRAFVATLMLLIGAALAAGIIGA